MTYQQRNPVVILDNNASAWSVMEELAEDKYVEISSLNGLEEIRIGLVGPINPKIKFLGSGDTLFVGGKVGIGGDFTPVSALEMQTSGSNNIQVNDNAVLFDIGTGNGKIHYIPANGNSGLVVNAVTGVLYLTSTLSRVDIQANSTIEMNNTVNILASKSGTLLSQTLRNSNIAALSSAAMNVQVQSAAAGDPYYQVGIQAGIQWSMSLDNDQSDRFSISQNAGPGTNDYLTITTAGLVNITNNLEVDGTLKVTGTITAENLSVSSLVATDVSGVFTSTTSGLSPTFSNLSITNNLDFGVAGSLIQFAFNTEIEENFGLVLTLQDSGGVNRFSVENSVGDRIIHADSDGTVGLGGTLAASTLSVFGNSTIGSSYGTTPGPANGLAVQGDVSIGIQVPTEKLHVVGNGLFTGQIFSPTHTLTDAATIAINCDDGNVQQVTLAANRILGGPTGLQEGAEITIRIIQDPTGGRTLTYNAAWDFGVAGVPTLSTAANKVDYISGIVRGTKIDVVFSGGYN